MRTQVEREEQALVLGGLVIVPALVFVPVALVLWLASSALGHLLGVDQILLGAAMLTSGLAYLVLRPPLRRR